MIKKLSICFLLLFLCSGCLFTKRYIFAYDKHEIIKAPKRPKYSEMTEEQKRLFLLGYEKLIIQHNLEAEKINEKSGY
jgi:hypothetical protein